MRPIRSVGRSLRRAIQRLTRAFGFEVVRRSNYHLVLKDYYSPIADLRELPAETWEQPSRLEGIGLDTTAQLAFAESKLAPFIQEFDGMLGPERRAGRFKLDNEMYDSVDAEILFAMVRHLKPARIIEAGSGNSTLVIGRASERNAREGARSTIEVFDPYPSDQFAVVELASCELQRQGIQQVPFATFEALERNDVLFVDTSHTVKVGGEVNFLVLSVLPRLQPGVYVHFHDIFLPWEYHRAWTDRGWNEQYLVQAFLALNPAYEVVFASHAIAREHPDRLESLVPSYHRHNQPSAFWIRRA